MKKDIKKSILALSQQIFEDDDYNKVLNYLNSNRINDLRVFISDKVELFENIRIIDNENNNLNEQLCLLDKLEDIILEEFLENVE